MKKRMINQITYLLKILTLFLREIKEKNKKLKPSSCSKFSPVSEFAKIIEGYGGPMGLDTNKPKKRIYASIRHLEV
ncbi:hypothetical protein BpHYR1_036327 [Brachionus plicatilis]|uniref:Uncharacterized protein n=1 Tax=Brachionus plicatilis TaxID=10195 RepID=A0A3M7QHD5_BRAPC|nr:hypothetical protein BpHYR1_036327 [Brachionus plicatilis]